MSAGDLRVRRVGRAAHGRLQDQFRTTTGQSFGLLGSAAGSTGGQEGIVGSQTLGAHDPELAGQGLARLRPGSHRAVLLDEDPVVVKEAAVAVAIPLRPPTSPAFRLDKSDGRTGRRGVAPGCPWGGRQRPVGQVRPFDQRWLLLGRAEAGREVARIPERRTTTGSRMGAHVHSRAQESARIEGWTGTGSRAAAHEPSIQGVGVPAVRRLVIALHPGRLGRRRRRRFRMTVIRRHGQGGLGETGRCCCRRRRPHGMHLGHNRADLSLLDHRAWRQKSCSRDGRSSDGCDSGRRGGLVDRAGLDVVVDAGLLFGSLGGCDDAEDSEGESGRASGQRSETGNRRDEGGRRSEMEPQGEHGCVFHSADSVVKGHGH